MLLSICHELCLERFLSLFSRRNAVLRHDEHLDLLHLVAVRNSDNTAHLDFVMRIEDVLELGRIDIVSG